MRRIALLALLLNLAAWSGLSAQPSEYNHPELEWFTIETEHFSVHFHSGAERTGRVVAKIAEEVYPFITSLYQYEPESKVQFVIRDHDDYSNGVTYFYDNKIEIWATSLNFELRGTHDWLRDVVTHEFTHMVQLQSSMKFGITVPAFYFQAIGYEEERRPDVLRGFPNSIVSYPIAGTTVPMWFAEGVAQYQVPGLDYDYWDSHRDMVLRSSSLGDKLLSYNEMGVFGKTSLGSEKVYDHGYALVTYIARKFEPDALRVIATALTSPLRLTVDGAIKKATGRKGPDLYDDWRAWMVEGYRKGTEDIRGNQREGEIIQRKGFANLHPAWSPDGETLAFTTNQGSDYFGLSALALYSIKTKKLKTAVGGVSSTFSWSKDGSYIIFSKKAGANRFGSRYFDLHLYDVKQKKTKRLTHGLRIHSPNLSLDENQVVCVFNADGTENIAIYDRKAERLTHVTGFKNGEQVFEPRWSPDGTRILFSVATKHHRNIATIRTDGRDLRYLIRGQGEARDAEYTADGQGIYFSWDRTGIFNIYYLDLASGQHHAVTNVVGGAFMPAISKDGVLAYALFNENGYKIAIQENLTPVADDVMGYAGPMSTLPSATNGGNPASSVDGIHISRVDDSQLPEFAPKPYSRSYGAVAFLPRAMIDYKTLKLGTYFLSSEVLDKMSLLGGVAANRDFDYDVFALVDYREFWPTIFFEGYHIRRHEGESVFNFTYKLSEAHFGLRVKPWSNHLLRLAFVYGQYDASISGPDGSIFIGEDNLEDKLSYTYFRGRQVQFEWQYRSVPPSVDGEINPTRGRAINLRVNREFNRFIDGFTVNTEYGTLQETYTPYDYTRIELDWREYHRGLFSGQGINLSLQGGYIDRPVDSFFNFYGGGLIGLKGYPFYSIEGRKMLIAGMTYRFPIFRHLDRRLGFLYFDKLFLGFYGQYGNAFDEDAVVLSDFKKDAGAQLRLDTFSFYGFPTKLFFDAVYGFDEFETRGQRFGKSWRYYFGVTFGYLD